MARDDQVYEVHNLIPFMCNVIILGLLTINITSLWTNYKGWNIQNFLSGPFSEKFKSIKCEYPPKQLTIAYREN